MERNSKEAEKMKKYRIWQGQREGKDAYESKLSILLEIFLVKTSKETYSFTYTHIIRIFVWISM